MFSKFSALLLINLTIVNAVIVPSASLTHVLPERSDEPRVSSLYKESGETLAEQIHNTTIPRATVCFSPRRFWVPIAVPADCDQAHQQILNGGNIDVPISWTGAHAWWLGSCAIILHPRAYHIPLDYFTRLEIAQVSMRIKDKCVTPEYGYMGGKQDIGGSGSFSVQVLGRPRGIGSTPTGSA